MFANCRSPGQTRIGKSSDARLGEWYNNWVQISIIEVQTDSFLLLIFANKRGHYMTLANDLDIAFHPRSIAIVGVSRSNKRMFLVSRDCSSLGRTGAQDSKVTCIQSTLRLIAS